MELLIPEPRWGTEEGEDPTCGVTPGFYEGNAVVELLREHKANPKAIMYMTGSLKEVELLIPEPTDKIRWDRRATFEIKPGFYEGDEVRILLERHRWLPSAIQYIADMLEA